MNKQEREWLWGFLNSNGLCARLCLEHIGELTTERDNTFAERDALKAETERLREAIKAVLSYISSHQVYDKDARGTLLRALIPPEGQ